MLAMLDGFCTRTSMCWELPMLSEPMLFGTETGVASTFTFRISSEVFSVAQFGSGRYVSNGNSNDCASDPRSHVECKEPPPSPSFDGFSPLGAASMSCSPSTQDLQYLSPSCPSGVTGTPSVPSSKACFAAVLSFAIARAMSRTSQPESREATTPMWSTMASNLGSKAVDSAGVTRGCLLPASAPASKAGSATSPRVFIAWYAQTFNDKPKICCLTS
mmetsp:Transcript_46139/g.128347  ORF Transcript_46139/g.128347 Transcript_46139/m.128347 type:complete len:217 (+) Transcript_46139:502-1152(+)